MVLLALPEAVYLDHRGVAELSERASLVDEALQLRD